MEKELQDTDNKLGEEGMKEGQDLSGSSKFVSLSPEELRKQFLLKFWLQALKSRSRHSNANEQNISSIKADTVFDSTSPSPSPNASQRTVGDLKSEDLTFGPEWEKDKVIRCLQTHGVCCLLPSADQDQNLLECCRLASEKRLSSLLESCSELGSDGVFTKELICRNPGRYDMPTISAASSEQLETKTQSPEEDKDGNSTLVSSIEGDPSECLRKNGNWLPIIKGILGVSAKMIHKGCVVATPGAALQGVHRDGKHLFSKEESNGSALPAHCLTVFIPLVDLLEEIGPTEFFPGTHNVFSDSEKDITPVKFSNAPAGSVIIFDYRILHHGLANESNQARPIEYFTYSKPWFKDATNYSSVPI